MPGSKKKPAAEPKAGNTLADKLARLGVAREQDLVLHLPLRYEDHTHLCPLAALKAGQAWQIEGTIANTEIQYRPRRQLVCLVEEGEAQLVLRFFHFYPSQQKALAPGKRVRAFGDVREGHFGLEIVHPSFQVVEPGTPLPDRLTPVYPTTAGLSQDVLRKLVRRTLVRDPAYVAETLPPWTREPRRLYAFAEAVTYLHDPPTDASQSALEARSHPAWVRLKFDELFAQRKQPLRVCVEGLVLVDGALAGVLDVLGSGEVRLTNVEADRAGPAQRFVGDLSNAGVCHLGGSVSQ